VESRALDRLEAGAVALGCPLDTTQLGMFEIYRSELLLWNRRTNLTAITDPEAVQVLHFLDSLTLAAFLPSAGTQQAPLTLLDVGTGAGFPGLALKIARPELRVWLLESTGKKVAFLRHMVDILKLSDVTVLHGRAEELAHDSNLRECFDVTVARAVGHLAILAELCLPFTVVNGRFFAMKKGPLEDELRQAAVAIRTLGGGTARVLPVTTEGLGDDRCLVTIEKELATSDKFPRRPGMPAKRPLGLNSA